MIGPATSCGNIDTKQAKSIEVAERLGVAAIDVDRVAHRLERVEADAQRQRHPERDVEARGVEAERRGEAVPAVDARS